jgi:1-aminocyclopropane-1-carboxylate deaminase
MLYSFSNIAIQLLQDELFTQLGITLSVLRLDKMHPVVSGNKLFKLQPFLQQACVERRPGVVTFGGAWSNHLVATAFAAGELGLHSAGIVRGELPAKPSRTLLQCIDYGMKLEFVSRQQYVLKTASDFIQSAFPQYQDYLLIPEGGYHPDGSKGAARIMKLVPPETTHICCAIGTATTFCGLLLNASAEQEVIAIPVLKNLHDLTERLSYLIGTVGVTKRFSILQNFHFGGYARKDTILVRFMNDLYDQHRLPTDFVYTAKMMYGVLDGIKKGMFPPGSRICCIHTGGLQGNLSLPPGTLGFGSV